MSVILHKRNMIAWDMRARHFFTKTSRSFTVRLRENFEKTITNGGYINDRSRISKYGSK